MGTEKTVIERACATQALFLAKKVVSGQELLVQNIRLAYGQGSESSLLAFLHTDISP